MLNRFFLDHPRALGETYFQHQRVAWRYGSALLGAGLACLLHGLVPAWCTSTASRAVSRLAGRMQTRR